MFTGLRTGPDADKDVFQTGKVESLYNCWFLVVKIITGLFTTNDFAAVCAFLGISELLICVGQNRSMMVGKVETMSEEHLVKVTKTVNTEQYIVS